MRDTSPDNLIEHIFYARFGINSNFQANKAALFNDMSEYYKIIREHNSNIITLPAIRNWFSELSPSIPKRIDALKFLHGYIVWINKNEYVNNINYWDSARTFLRKYNTPVILADSKERELYKSQPKDWRGDLQTWKSAIKLGGLYQIIRPSASKVSYENLSSRKSTYTGLMIPSKGEYVCEIMSINPHSRDNNNRVIMYSHKIPDKKYLYRGSLDLTTRTMFSLMSREHNDFPERRSFRSIIAFTYNSTECFSGILLRNMSDDSGAGKRCMAVPFVAIKTPYEFSSINTTELVPINKRRGIYELGDSVILGGLNPFMIGSGRLYDMCDDLFQNLNTWFHLESIDGTRHPNGELIITSCKPDIVRDVFEKSTGLAEDIFKQWSDTVNSCSW